MIASPWKNERVLESFAVAIFILDADWRFQYVNPSAEQVLKRSAEELEGRNVWTEFPESAGTVFEREYRRAMNEDIAVRFEAFYAPLDVWVQVYAFPTDDGLMVIFQDITERKTAEQDAERLEARNRAIIRALPDDLYLISASGVIVEAEKGGVGTTEDLDAMLGRSIDEVFPEDVARRFHEAIANVRSTGETRIMSFELPSGMPSLRTPAASDRTPAPFGDGAGDASPRGDMKPLDEPPADVESKDAESKDGESKKGKSKDRVSKDAGGDASVARFLEARVVPVQGNGVLAIVRDITTQRSLQRQVLQVAKKERERIGRDLHDGLGSLLSGISMMSSSLARDAEEGCEVNEEQLREISRLAKEGVTQARALSRGLNPIDVEPDRFVASVREMAANTRTMTGLQCYLDDPDEIEQLKEEVATQLYWVAQEAVNNAVRHSGCSEIAIGIWLDGDDLLVRVRDDGSGLPEASSGGMGRKTMRYRAQVIGASLDIRDREPTPMRREPADDAEPTGGVDVVCRVPVWKAISDAPPDVPPADASSADPPAADPPAADPPAVDSPAAGPPSADTSSIDRSPGAPSSSAPLPDAPPTDAPPTDAPRADAEPPGRP